MSSKASKKLYLYGSNQSLQFAGTFTTEVSVAERVLSGVEFIVIENKGQAPLGRETAIALGALKLGTPAQVNSLEASTDGAKGAPSVLEKIPRCCEGSGKLKDLLPSVLNEVYLLPQVVQFLSWLQLVDWMLIHSGR